MITRRGWFGALVAVVVGAVWPGKKPEAAKSLTCVLEYDIEAGAVLCVKHGPCDSPSPYRAFLEKKGEANRTEREKTQLCFMREWERA